MLSDMQTKNFASIKKKVHQQIFVQNAVECSRIVVALVNINWQESSRDY